MLSPCSKLSELLGLSRTTTSCVILCESKHNAEQPFQELVKVQLAIHVHVQTKHALSQLACIQRLPHVHQHFSEFGFVQDTIVICVELY